jgi:multidrug resistance efflux pump
MMDTMEVRARVSGVAPEPRLSELSPSSGNPSRSIPLVPVLLTASVVIIARLLGWAMWQSYMGTPWTRDGTVRAYVVTETPEVSGRIVSLPAATNQFVHKGDLLMEIEPTNYQITVANAEAALEQAKANLTDKQAEAARRQKLPDIATSVEETQNYVTQAQVAQAVYNADFATLAQARVNLARTRMVSPVNGYITNLLVQVGDYATAGQRALSIVNTDSFWVDGYFEETLLDEIHIGDPARIRLLSHNGVLSGHVAGIARGIEVPNAQPDGQGLANVNPIFTWIRLAQRVPVEIAIDHVPPGVTLVEGLTATVEIDPAPPATPSDGTPQKQSTQSGAPAPSSIQH